MTYPLDISCTINGHPSDGARGAKIPIIGGMGKSQDIKFTIVNMTTEPVRFDSYKHGYKRRNVTVTMKDEKHVSKGTAHTLRPAESVWVKFKLTPQQYCGIYLTIEFNFYHGPDGEKWKIIRYVTYDCVPEDERTRGIFNRTAPITDPESDEEEDEEQFDNLEIIEFPGHKSESMLVATLPLEDYIVEDYVKQLVFAPHSAGKLENIRVKLNIRHLHRDLTNYSEFFNGLLDLEEIQHWRDIRHYTIKNASIVKVRNTDSAGNNRFRLKVPGLAEKRPSVLRGDRLYVTPLPPASYKYEGNVDDTSQSDAYLVFSPRFEEDIDDVYGWKFRIEFTIDRLSMRLMHRAVDIVQVAELGDVLFPLTKRPPRNPDTLVLDCFEERVESNEEQLTAIKHIVAGTSLPAPYLIYGPPGTGKTFTLVEAIKQVCKTVPQSKILVCAPQNDAADLIAERLLNHVNPNSIIRFNAVSRFYDSLSDKIQSISNYSQMHQRTVFPPKDELIKKQIVVSTLVTSGRLVSAEMTDHFTHIFIDEAGHASEPETVIPLGLLSTNMKHGGQVVLAGDPKQLGAIIRSTLAEQHGLGLSLLERLMNMENGIYGRGTEDRPTYDNNYVTKLLKNFRSHPAILEVPNQRFYEFELQPCADESERDKFCGWKHLPDFSLIRWEMDRIGFPLIFRQVNGREEQEMSSPSWFNRHEILVVVEYIELLLFGSTPSISPADIGIISPYIQQVRKIRRALREIDMAKLGPDADIDDIKVGSVEKFQGDEREVIIISTVRSQSGNMAKDKKFNLGFVSNSKRFNVAVTRAKSLLIVIGNPLVLCTDENWRRLIQHIIEGGGYIGEELSEEMLRIETEELNEAMGSATIADMPVEEGGKSAHLLHHDDEYEARA